MRYRHQLLEGTRYARGVLGNASMLAASGAKLPYALIRWGFLGKYIWLGSQIPGCTRGPEAVALARASRELHDGAVIVEIGAFLGGSTVLLAGARKLRGSGRVHCVDPYDASGDPFSAPVYAAIQRADQRSLRQRFDHNIRRAGLLAWVEVHQARAVEVAVTWTEPVDLLFLDGDQSYVGVREAYQSWAPFLKAGGVIAVHNSAPRAYADGHDGHRRLVLEEITPPEYGDIGRVGSTTFARKVHRPS